MRDPSVRELETVAELRIALRRFMAATDEATAVNGLTPRQYDLLALLHSPRASEPLTPTAIATLLALSRSATTELLGRAVAAGLVVRANPADDARVKHVTSTAAGTRRFFATVIDLRGERTRLLALLETAMGLANELGTKRRRSPSRSKSG